MRRTPPGVRAVDNRDMRPRRRSVSQSDGMFGAGRTCEDFRDSSLVRTHAQSCAALESPRARLPYSGRRCVISFDSAARRCAPVEVQALPDRLRPWTPYSSTPRATTATIGCTSYEPAAPTAVRMNRISRALKARYDKGYTESTTHWRASTSLKQATFNRPGNNRHEGNKRASGTNACYRNPSCKQD